MTKDSSRPEFWDERFRDGVTPWDAGGVPLALRDWLKRQPSQMRVLVPGCGSGHEVRLFAERGDDVLGIDFSDAALDTARRKLGKLAGRVRKADFFQLDEGRFDLVYERTFLCAMPRSLWSLWGRKIAEVVRPGGRLAGFFYVDDNERGPPFGIDTVRLAELRGENFELIDEERIPAEQSVPVLAGKEVWQVWKRRL